MKLILNENEMRTMWNNLCQGAEACQFILNNTDDQLLIEQYTRYKKHLVQSMNKIFPTPEL